jgi:uncharacterized protein YqjF (DUF2071 family)
MSNTFLTAAWEKLLMINYVIDPKKLIPYLPADTELDVWEGRCYISLVGFMFTNVRIKGIAIPFHTSFEEINLRFYVKFNENGIWKRGVVFVKEIVPKPAITIVANTLYNENYQTLPLKHSWTHEPSSFKVDYAVKKSKWHSIGIQTNLVSKPIEQGSEAEFITEHYWGYAKINEQKTNEYQVEHPKWEVYDTINYNVNVDFNILYGKDFEFLNGIKPTSAFLAEGSKIKIKQGKKITKELN